MSFRNIHSVSALGSVEDDLKLCKIERDNQAQMYAACKGKAPLVLGAALFAGIVGYLIGRG